jgi:hypothetical protein
MHPIYPLPEFKIPSPEQAGEFSVRERVPVPVQRRRAPNRFLGGRERGSGLSLASATKLLATETDLCHRCERDLDYL